MSLNQSLLHLCTRSSLSCVSGGAGRSRLPRARLSESQLVGKEAEILYSEDDRECGSTPWIRNGTEKPQCVLCNVLDAALRCHKAFRTLFQRMRGSFSSCDLLKTMTFCLMTSLNVPKNTSHLKVGPDAKRVGNHGVKRILQGSTSYSALRVLGLRRPSKYLVSKARGF